VRIKSTVLCYHYLGLNVDTHVGDKFLRQQFPGNIIPASRIA